MNKDNLLVKLRSIFLEELEENVCVIERMLVALEDGSLGYKRAEVVDELYRAFHSIKGASATVQADKIKDLAHSSESLLSSVKDGAKSLDERSIQLLFNCVDQFRILGKEMGSCDRVVAPLIEGSSVVKDSLSSTTSNDILNERSDRKEIKKNKNTINTLRDYSEDYVSISSKRLERMQNLVLNLDIYVRGISQLSLNYEQDLNQLKPSQFNTIDKSTWRSLQVRNSRIVKSIQKIESMLDPLDDEILKANMQRFSVGFSWLPRMVRDQAIESGRKCN